MLDEILSEWRLSQSSPKGSKLSNEICNSYPSACEKLPR